MFRWKSIGYSFKFNQFFKVSALIVLVLTVVASLFASTGGVSPVHAATTLTVNPITWNVIGLDSNNVAVGPNHFPIGARVCNTGASAASNVTARFVWDTTDTYIYLRPGTVDTLTSLSIPSTDPDTCVDFYFEVEVDRNPSAYNHTAQYHIEVTESGSSGTTWSTPTPRELFVEHLISQSRNSVTGMELSTDGITFNNIAQGGTMSLMVGETYWINLIASTATNGYEQLESFINFPNTIFQVLEVDTTYTAPPSGANDKLYADGCTWVNNPLSPNYRSCLSAGKNGGDIVVTYKIKILSVPGAPLYNPEPLSTLVYDFSGSSYHYNADFSSSVRFAQIVSPAAIAKTFSPNTIAANGVSTLTYTIKNSGSKVLDNVNFADTSGWPAGLTVNGLQSPSYSADCGTAGSQLPQSIAGGATSASFSNITLAANGACTISITVTSAVDGTYPNSTQNLFIDTLDTGSKAAATLSVSSVPSMTGYTCGTSQQTMATWDFGVAPVDPFTTTASITPATGAPISFATAATSTLGTFTASTTDGNPANSRTGTGWSQTAGDITGAVPYPPDTLVYYQFDIDTSNYSGVSITFDYRGPTSDYGKDANNFIYVYSDTLTFGSTPTWASGSGQSFYFTKSNDWNKGGTPFTHAAVNTGTNTTRFFITVYGASKAASELKIDTVIIKGCARPVPPTLAKTFLPATIGSDNTDPVVGTTVNYSTLTFRVDNPNASALTGVEFIDALPTGLVVANPNGTPTLSCESGTLTGAIRADAGSNTISLTGGDLSASAVNCTFSVRVQGQAAGSYTNTTSRIKADYTGPNTTGGADVGYGTDPLTVVDAPVISKVFGADSIFTNGATTLTFTMTNPNPSLALTGVNFIGGDSLPSGLVVATPNDLTSVSCSNGALTDQTITATEGSSSVTMTGGALSAAATCTFSLSVKDNGTSTGLKTNSVQLGSTNGGNSKISTAQILVKDKTPDLSFKKQVSVNGTDWYDSVIIPANDPVWYKFTVENTGDQPLTLNPATAITDDTFSPDCTGLWSNPVAPLPVAIAANELHLSECIVQNGNAAIGSVKNTAHATGTYGSAPYNSGNDSATYQNGNFGHLPSAYVNTNLYNDGGAMQANGATYLGSRLPGLGADPAETDGINEPAYIPQATDDGITLSGAWDSGTGSADVIATCATTGTRDLYAWFDWSAPPDGDFSDLNEGPLHWTVACDGNGETTPITIDYPGTGVLPAGTYYARFRIYDTTPASPQPYGASTIVGEIEDYPIVSLGDGTTPTPVTVAYFQSRRQGGNINFEWSTATETGNVGFNLYVEKNGERVRLNDQLIPSQAADSLTRLDYSYRASVNGNIFYIEDVSVAGETRLHGPFGLAQTYGSRIQADKVDWLAIQKQNQAQQTARQNSLKPDLLKSKFGAATLNLKVRQTGMYRVSYEMLKNAGLDLAGVASSKITLSNQGKTVPIYMQAAKGGFGPGSFIEFYGQALDTIYTDTNIYTLQLTQKSIAPIPLINARPAKGTVPPAAYTETLVVNNQRAFANYAPGNDGWYDTSMLVYKTSKSWNFPIQINGLANPNSTAEMELVVWGVTNFPQTPDHHLLVSVNGVAVADQFMEGLVEKTLKIQLPAGVLKEGANTLQLTLPGDTGVDWDMVVLDKYSLKYQRAFQAQDGRLTFTAAGKVFTVTNLPEKNVVVYRSDKKGIQRLQQIQVQAAGSSYTAVFAGTDTPATYMISSASALYSPTLEVTRLRVNLNQPAEYLIISHPDFIAGLQPLVQARQAQGLTVSVVDVTDIYTQYGYGIFDPRAIQKYIAYAAKTLGAQYVLLVGGDTYDYRNYLGRNSISFIPSLYVSTGEIARFVPADPLFADVDQNNVPDLAIGRFPVRTTAELNMIVNKTLAYAGKDYGQTAVFASDLSDGVVSFKGISNEISAELPAEWSVENIHLDDVSVSAAQTRLIAAMNRGTALVTFTGHSGPQEWTFSNLFNISHAKTLSNVGRPFVALQWGCWNTYYVDPVYTYMVQSFLFSGEQGAAAVLGSSTLTESSSERQLGELLTPRLVTPGMTMGQALQDAKSELAQSHPELLDVLLGWSLMGDPALMIEP